LNNNRLNDIIQLLSDVLVNENEPNMEMILKIPKFWKHCQLNVIIFEAIIMTVFFIVMVLYHSCIAKPLIVIVIHAQESEIN